MGKIVKIQKILIESDKIDRLIRDFDCGRATVFNALAFRSNSQQAKEIRDRACNRYGGEVVKIPVMM